MELEIVQLGFHVKIILTTQISNETNIACHFFSPRDLVLSKKAFQSTRRQNDVQNTLILSNGIECYVLH